MKVLILAGGYGTRLSEETDIRPKPMVEVGNKPIFTSLIILSYQFYNQTVPLCIYLFCHKNV